MGMEQFRWHPILELFNSSTTSAFAKCFLDPMRDLVQLILSFRKLGQSPHLAIGPIGKMFSRAYPSTGGTASSSQSIASRHDYMDSCLYLYLEHVPGGSITQARLSWVQLARGAAAETAGAPTEVFQRGLRV